MRAMLFQHHLNQQTTKFTIPLLVDQHLHRLLLQVYTQKSKVGMGDLARGIIVRNWIAFQNLCDNKDNIEEVNYEWEIGVIQSRWT